MLAHQQRIDRDDRHYQRYFTLTNLYNNPAVSGAGPAAVRGRPGQVAQQPELEAGHRRAGGRRREADRVRRRHPQARLGPPRPLARGAEGVPLRPQRTASTPTTTKPRKAAERPVRPGGTRAAGRARRLVHRHGVPAAAVPHAPATAGRTPATWSGGSTSTSRRTSQDDKLARAGFTTSGVSKHNRLVERHERGYGAYWKSYDFKSDDGTANLIGFPLGPALRGQRVRRPGLRPRRRRDHLQPAQRPARLHAGQQQGPAHRRGADRGRPRQGRDVRLGCGGQRPVVHGLPRPRHEQGLQGRRARRHAAARASRCDKVRALYPDSRSHGASCWTRTRSASCGVWTAPRGCS